ncbi:MAG: peptidoglycan-binding domain-containing protein [Paracoccaceae bacterium]
MRHWATMTVFLAAAACQQTTVTPPALRNDLSAELIRLDGTRPPEGPPGACWDRDTLPTVIETVTDQILVTPEERGPDGAIIRPAVFRTETSQQIVQDRGQVWFRAPCIAEQTVDFVASLQRALKARGFYLAPVNGAYDPATAEAVRRYQAGRGFDSPRLTLAAARELGLIAADLGLPPPE